jgi:hypothetical protein
MRLVLFAAAAGLCGLCAGQMLRNSEAAERTILNPYQECAPYNYAPVTALVRHCLCGSQLTS